MHNLGTVVQYCRNNSFTSEIWWLFCLYIWKEPGWGQQGILSLVQETEREEILSEAQWVMSWSRCLSFLCPQTDTALGCLQPMQGRGDIPDRGTREESQVPLWSLRDSVQPHGRGWSGPWTSGAAKLWRTPCAWWGIVGLVLRAGISHWKTSPVAPFHLELVHFFFNRLFFRAV